MRRQRTNPVHYIAVQREGASESERVKLGDRLLKIEYEDGDKKADLLKITLDNADLTLLDDPVWDEGNKVFVQWGYVGWLTPMREAIIQRVTGFTTLVIHAHSKATLLNKDKKKRTFDNVKRSEAVAKIAKEWGYSGEQADIEETDEVFPHILQPGETDAQFLKRLADAEHFDFYIDFDGFHWHSRRMGQKPIRTLQYFLPPRVGDILEVDTDTDIFKKPGAVKTEGRDPITKKDVGGEGSDSKTERDALSPVTEVVDPQTGLSTFRVNSSSSDIKTTSSTSNAQAKKEADGAFKKSVQSTVKLKVKIVGDPDIVAKTVIEITGISRKLSGRYYISHINHEVHPGGYTMLLNVQTDGTQGPAKNDGSCEKCKADLRVFEDRVIADIRAGRATEAEARPRIDAARKRCEEACKGSKSTLNDKGNADQNEATLVEKVDGETGLTTFQYTDTKGREKGDKK